MKTALKLVAVLSAVFLLTACDTAPQSGAGAKGAGTHGTGENPNATPGSQDDLTSNVGDRVFFEYDSASVDNEGQETLKRQAEWLKKYSDVNVTVEGHCDERGTREYNLALGERRATSAKKYLASLGVSASRISTISYGKERPAVVGSDDSSWSQNRRAVTVIANQ